MRTQAGMERGNWQGNLVMSQLVKIGSKGRTRTVKSDSDTRRMRVFPLKLKNNLP
jgi:hypothetical protein